MAKGKAAAKTRAKKAKPAGAKTKTKTKSKSKAKANAKSASAAKPSAAKPKQPARAKTAKAKLDPSTIQARPAPKVGSDAPEFALPSTAGGTLDLAALRGKKVVLYFYPKDDTPGCTAEACAFRDRIAAIEHKGAVVLGVSRDSLAAHQKFKTKYELPFDLLSDPEGRAISSYGSWGEKSFMGRRFMGILRTTVLIDEDGKIQKVYPKVSPKTHAEEILADL
jgi:peroxiredoxin Q/BCP